jgi:hypothetical protein
VIIVLLPSNASNHRLFSFHYSDVRRHVTILYLVVIQNNMLLGSGIRYYEACFHIVLHAGWLDRVVPDMELFTFLHLASVRVRLSESFRMNSSFVRLVRTNDVFHSNPLIILHWFA